MFVSAIKIKNYKCFDNTAVEDFNVPNGSPGSGLNVLVGENGTGKTSLLEAINYLTESRFSIENRASIHDFQDVAEPIEITYTSSAPFRCLMPKPYDPCYFEAKGISTKINSRKQKSSGKLLSSPYTVGQSYLPTTANYKRQNGSDSGKGIEAFHRSCDRASVVGDGLNIFYFDKNRSRHLTHGTYRTTFERICDDLNWRFVKAVNKDPKVRAALEAGLAGDYFALAKDVAQGGVGEKTASALAEFLDDPLYESLRVDLINYLHPFSDARLALRDEGHLEQVLVKDLGSGVEVIVALLMLRSVSAASKGETVYLIDEPEAHLHPKAQQSLVSLLLDESRNSQVFLSTHSPYMFKDALPTGPGVFTFEKTAAGISIQNANDIGRGGIPWGPTWGEISYQAYGLPTVELHNELYGYIQEATGSSKEKDLEAFLEARGTPKSKSWIRSNAGKPQAAYDVTVSTYIRNSIHHPENEFNAAYEEDELAASIDVLSRIVDDLAAGSP